MPADSVEYQYDENGRLINVLFDNDDEIDITYDEAGNRESVVVTL